MALAASAVAMAVASCSGASATISATCRPCASAFFSVSWSLVSWILSNSSVMSVLSDMLFSSFCVSGSAVEAQTLACRECLGGCWSRLCLIDWRERLIFFDRLLRADDRPAGAVGFTHHP